MIWINRAQIPMYDKYFFVHENPLCTVFSAVTAK